MASRPAGGKPTGQWMASEICDRACQKQDCSHVLLLSRVSARVWGGENRGTGTTHGIFIFKKEKTPKRGKRVVYALRDRVQYAWAVGVATTPRSRRNTCASRATCAARRAGGRVRVSLYFLFALWVWRWEAMLQAPCSRLPAVATNSWPATQLQLLQRHPLVVALYLWRCRRFASPSTPS